MDTFPPRRAPRRSRVLLAGLCSLLLGSVLLGTLALPGQASAQSTLEPESATRLVRILPLRDGFIDPPVVDQIGELLDLAEAEGAELVILQLTSRGGVSVDTAAITARIARSSVPVAVYIGPLGTGPRAEGAAGAIWLAAHLRALAPDATVGPLAPLDLRALDAPLPDPAGIIAGTPRATPAPAATPGSALARLVDETVSADDLAAEGIGRITTGIDGLLIELDGVEVLTAAGPVLLELRPGTVQVRLHSLGPLRRLLHAASTAPFVYLLLVVGLSMLLFEVFQPGFGVAGLAGIVTALVGLAGAFVLPVRWWAVGLVVLGLLLYALDTAVAGFGPVTLAATAAFATGSWWFYLPPSLRLDGWLVGLATASAFIFFVLVLTVVLRAQAGPEGTAVEDLVGRPGVVRSVLNPEGHVFIDGALWRARWTGEGRASVGTPVAVRAVDGPVILVEAFDPDRDPEQGLSSVGDRS